MKSLSKLPKKPNFINTKTVLITITLIIAIGLITTGVYFGMVRPTIEPWSDARIAREQARELTSQLFEEAEGTATREELQEIANNRSDYMISLMQDDPAAFLETAITLEIRTEMFEGIDNIEEQTDLVGRVEIIAALPSDDMESKPLGTSVTLTTNNNETYKVRLVDEALASNLTTGDTLSLSGYALAGNIVPDTLSDTGNFNVLAQTAPMAASTNPETRVRNVVVMRVNFSDIDDGELSEYYNDDWAREHVARLSRNLEATSLIQSIGNPTIRTVNINRGNTCDYTGWRDRAISASGINVNNYDHVFLLFSSPATADLPRSLQGMWTCNQFIALGSVETPQTRGAVTWYRLDEHINQEWLDFVFMHELGHNFGFRHAQAALCFDDSGNTTRISDNCHFGGNRFQIGGNNFNQDTSTMWNAILEYGDAHDSMGHGRPSRGFQAHFRNQAGWLRATNVQTVTESGTFPIYPRGNNNNMQLLRVPTSLNGVVRNYILDYDPNYGVAVRTYDGATTHLFSRPLGVGEAHYDANRVEFRVEEANNTRAIVNIRDMAPCIRQPLTATVTPVPSTTGPNSYQVTVRNNNSSGCEPIEYTITRNAVPGIAMPQLVEQRRLNSLATETRDFQVTHNPATTANGSYPISFTIRESSTGFAKTLNSTYVVNNSTVPQCVRANPTITINPVTRTTISGTAVEYIATIRNNDSNLCSATTFDTSLSLPAEFTEVASNSASIAPGSSRTKTFRVMTPATAPPATHTLIFSVVAAERAVVSVPAQLITTPVPPAPLADPCRRNAPSVSISPSSQRGTIGEARTYRLTIRNNNVSCKAETFNVSTTVPRGFTINRANLTFNLGSGASSTQNFVLTPGSSARRGVHSLNINIRDGSGINNRTMRATYALITQQAPTQNRPTPPRQPNNNNNNNRPISRPSAERPPADTEPQRPQTPETLPPTEEEVLEQEAAPGATPTISTTGIEAGERISSNSIRIFNVVVSDADEIYSIGIYLNNTRVQTCNSRLRCRHHLNLGRLSAGNYLIRTVVIANNDEKSVSTSGVNFIKVENPPRNPLPIIGNSIRITMATLFERFSSSS